MMQQHVTCALKSLVRDAAPLVCNRARPKNDSKVASGVGDADVVKERARFAVRAGRKQDHASLAALERQPRRMSPHLEAMSNTTQHGQQVEHATYNRTTKRVR